MDHNNLIRPKTVTHLCLCLGAGAALNELMHGASLKRALIVGGATAMVIPVVAVGAYVGVRLAASRAIEAVTPRAR